MCEIPELLKLNANLVPTTLHWDTGESLKKHDLHVIYHFRDMRILKVLTVGKPSVFYQITVGQQAKVEF
jgi:hypothetical protein